jgi:Flp pilus assembly protein TadD
MVDEQPRAPAPRDEARDEALLLVKAVELRQGVPSFHNNLGMALEHTGRFKAAAAAYKAALTVDAGYDKAKRNLARVESVQGKSEELLDAGSPANAGVEKTAKGGAGKTPNN